MFFRTWVCLNNSKSLQAVQNDRSVIRKSSLYSQISNHCERASRYTPHIGKGSMTVEAAFVFPLFLFGMIAFLYLFLLLQLQTQVGRAMTDAGKILAQEAYLTDSEQGVGNSVAATAYVNVSINRYLEGRAAANILSEGTGGISTLGTVWNVSDSTLTLRASYQVILPPGITWFRPIRIMQEKTVRGWTGFGSRQTMSEEAGEELVYVTDYGTVYHRSLSCHHLKLSIRQTALGGVEALRNTGGGKYYPCERCWEQGSTVVYITEDGNRYHESLNCSGLTRGIHTMRLSETGGLPPCSNCGG
jgi:hypothetical protein